MPAKQIIFDEEARVALKRGADTLADAVKVTLGPRVEMLSFKIFRGTAGDMRWCHRRKRN